MIDTSLFDNAMMDASILQETNQLDLTKFYDCDDSVFDTAMDGVEIADDFDGLLFAKDTVDSTLAPTAMFTPPRNLQEPSDEEAFVASTLSEPIADRKGRSPPKQRRRKRRSTEMEGTTTSPVPPPKLLVTSSQLTADLPTVDIDAALVKLASSMKRSEESRNEIIRRQKQLGGSDDSCTRSIFPVPTSTLSSKLDQSRSMLQSYISQMKGPIMS